MIIYPPNSILEKGKAIFLAGSIEMGKATNWQEYLIVNIDHSNLLFLNPRRKDWNNSWKEDKNNPQFAEQVNWQLREAFYFLERREERSQPQLISRTGW